MDDSTFNTHFFYEETPRLRFIIVTESDHVIVRFQEDNRAILLAKPDVEKIVSIFQRWLGYGR